MQRFEVSTSELNRCTLFAGTSKAFTTVWDHSGECGFKIDCMYASLLCIAQNIMYGANEVMKCDPQTHGHV